MSFDIFEKLKAYYCTSSLALPFRCEKTTSNALQYLGKLSTIGRNLKKTNVKLGMSQPSIQLLIELCCCVVLHDDTDGRVRRLILPTSTINGHIYGVAVALSHTPSRPRNFRHYLPVALLSFVPFSV